MAELDGFCDGDGAAVGSHLVGEQTKQSGFAGAVGADEADALAEIDLEIEMLEDDTFAESPLEIGDGGDGHVRRAVRLLGTAGKFFELALDRFEAGGEFRQIAPDGENSAALANWHSGGTEDDLPGFDGIGDSTLR